MLDKERTPGVMSLKECLLAWLDFQFEVLVKRSLHRIAWIDDRLELVGGFLIAFLNLDRIIAIIRGEDEPKPVMIAEFALSERQAEAILNMRLRSLRKLEELELAKEREALAKERAELDRLVGSRDRQKTRLKRDLAAMKDKFGDERRTTIRPAAASARADIDWTQMIEKEPVTIILSQRGWIRAMKGHAALDEVAAMKWREGDGPFRHFHAQTTDRLGLFASNGRAYTLAADKLPGARGFGEPVRLFIDLDAEVDIVQLLVIRPEMKLLAASSDGRGFVASGEAVLGETRKGKQLVNLRPGARLAVIRPVPRRCGYGRGDRREPQDAGLPLVRTARNGARAGGDPAALPRRRAVRHQAGAACRWPQLDPWRRKRAHPHRNRPCPVACRPRRCRAHAAGRFPAQQSLRLTN